MRPLARAVVAREGFTARAAPRRHAEERRVNGSAFALLVASRSQSPSSGVASHDPDAHARVTVPRVPPLPEPLPPAERTVGQLVAEGIRLYGRRFWPSLALGIGPAVLNVAVRSFDRSVTVLLIPTVGGAVLAASYVGAVAIAANRPIRVLPAWLAGTLVFVPFPFLVTIFIFPGLIWLALFGLVVPVVALEGRALGAGFRRALELGRADFVHALGSLAALAIVVALTQGVLIFVLRGFGDQALAAASFIASTVVSPLLFLGAALLYYDQAARQDARATRRPSLHAR